MASSCLGDRKQVQDARFDSHLTDVKKESFYWRTKIIAHNKGFLRKKKKIRHIEKVSSVKTKSTVSFSSLMQRWSILETGQCLSRSRFHLSSVCLCRKKKTLQKAKKLSKVSLICCHCRRICSLIVFWENLSFC